MAATLVQSVTNTSATTNSTTLAIGSAQGWVAPSAGNLLVAHVNADNTVTGPAGWTAGPSVVDGNGAYTYWKIAAGTETTTTFTGSSSGTICGGLFEYSGVAAFDVQPTPTTVSGTAANSTTSLSGTGAGASGDLWVAFALLHDNSGSTAPTGASWSGGFTNRQSVTAGVTNTIAYCYSYAADFQNTGTGTVTTQCTWTGGTMKDRQELLMGFTLSGGVITPIPLLVMART